MKRMIWPSAERDLVEDRLQPLLELAAVLRARDQRADVERPDALALQSFRDVTGDDPLREALDDRGLADAWVADQHRVVLRSPRQHLDHTADFLVAADHRVELAFLRRSGEVASELLERLVGLLRVLRGHALAAAHRLDLRLELITRDDVEREQEMLRRDVVVFQPLRLVAGLVEHAREGGRDIRLLLRALDRRLRAQRRLGLRAQLRRIGNELLRELLVEQRQQQVLGIELGIAHAGAQAPARPRRLPGS